MPVEAKYFPQHDLRWVRYSQTVTACDLADITQQIYIDRRLPLAGLEFVDFEAVTGFALGFAEVAGVHDIAVGAYRAVGRMLRLSCHAPTELGYGMGRMYTTLLNNSGQAEAFVSRDRAEALDWLGLQALPHDMPACA